MDLINKIKKLNWYETRQYHILGGFNYEFTADNGDRIILSTCSSIRTKYITKDESINVFGEQESYIINKFWK